MTYSAKNKAFGKRQTAAYDMLIREESSLAAALQRDDTSISRSAALRRAAAIIAKRAK